MEKKQHIFNTNIQKVMHKSPPVHVHMFIPIKDGPRQKRVVKRVLRRSLRHVFAVCDSTSVF